MIDEQLEAYPGHERFVLAIVGLHSLCGDFVSALQIERQDAGAREEGAHVDFALGVVSLARTLHATLSALPSPPSPPPPPPSSLSRSSEAAAPHSPEPAGTPRWLR